VLKLADNLSLPLDFVTQTQAILAQRRRGKTYTASVQAEEFLKAKQQIVVIDVTGAWWGLKSSADGKSDGFSIVVAGGEHADIPLTPDSGELLARAIASDHFSCILDLKLLRKGQRLQFLASFLEAFHSENRTPVHVFADEADDYVPQQIYYKDQFSARCLGAMDDLVRRGGINGIGATLITQRPAVINNNVLTQCQLLTLLRLSHPADIKPVREWVKVHATAKEEADVIAALPTLGLGEAIFWSPGWPEDKPIGIKRVQIRERTTFNSSRTPKQGERIAAPKILAKPDLEKLGERIKQIAEKAKADDPKELRKRIGELERELKAKPAAVDQSQVKALRLELGESQSQQRTLRNMVLQADRLLKRITSLCGEFNINEVPDATGIPRAPSIDPAAALPSRREHSRIRRGGVPNPGRPRSDAEASPAALTLSARTRHATRQPEESPALTEFQCNKTQTAHPRRARLV
jgi:hypothetical protein